MSGGRIDAMECIQDVETKSTIFKTIVVVECCFYLENIYPACLGTGYLLLLGGHPELAVLARRRKRKAENKKRKTVFRYMCVMSSNQQNASFPTPIKFPR